MPAFSFNDYVGIATIVGAVGTIIPLLIQNIKLKDKNAKSDRLNPSLEVLANFKEVWEKVEAVTESELKESNEFKIRNIGLDLEKILPKVKELIDKYVINDHTITFSYKGVIIDPKSPAIEPLINEPSNIRNTYVAGSFARLDDYHIEYKDLTNIKLEVKSYVLPPIIHGLIINKKHLFLGLTEFKEKKLFGSDCPYIYLKFDRKVVATSHYFKVFIDWFNYYWENGK